MEEQRFEKINWINGAKFLAILIAMIDHTYGSLGVVNCEDIICHTRQ